MMSSTIPAAVLTLAAITGQPRGEVLDFSASWCGPCQQMSPIVSRLKRQGYPIRKVDVDSNRALAQKFGISSIPAFVLVVDGREVTRLVGTVSERQLLSMLSQIPSEPPVMTAGHEDSPHPRDRHPARTPSTNAGPPASQPRTSVGELTQPVAVVAEEHRHDHRSGSSSDGNGRESSPGLFEKLFGRGKRKDAPGTPDVVRANNDSEPTEPANVLPVRNPVQASVRLHVTTGGQTHMGSGTAIASRPGQTIIATCGHLFNGWNDRSKIEVDLFLDGEMQRFVGRMIHYDVNADVGIIGIPTDEIVPTAEVGDVAASPEVRQPLVSIGCSGGAAPSQNRIHVTALNYYEGPDNIECTGVPVQGRSGGGLFNRDGQLVGICIAADAERQRGAYAGLLAIHDMLAAVGMSDLYQRVAQTSTSTKAEAQAPPMPTSSIASTRSTPQPRARAGQPTAFSSQSSQEAEDVGTEPAEFDPFASPSPTDTEAGDMEVICIIRSRQHPDAPSRVVIINRPSTKFLSYLDGEVAAGETPGRKTRRMAPESSPSSTPAYPATSSRFAIPRQQTDSPQSFPTREHSRIASLQPTALSQPLRPQQYTRSPHTRFRD